MTYITHQNRNASQIGQNRKLIGSMMDVMCQPKAVVRDHKRFLARIKDSIPFAFVDGILRKTIDIIWYEKLGDEMKMTVQE